MRYQWAIYSEAVIGLLFLFGLCASVLMSLEQLQVILNTTEEMASWVSRICLWGTVVMIVLLLGTLRLGSAAKAVSGKLTIVPHLSSIAPIEIDRHESLTGQTSVVPQYFNHIGRGKAQCIGDRREQQDAYGFSDALDADRGKSIGTIAVLTDGMGELEMGRETSLLAVQTMLRTYRIYRGKEPVPQMLRRGIVQANEEVYRLAVRKDLEWNIGTTLAACVIDNRDLHWIAAGDSRIYLYRGGQLTQLTTDHIYAKKLNEDVRIGKITQEEADMHPQRNTLISYLGISELEEIDQNTEPVLLQAGDWILLCSDGFYRGLSASELASVCEMAPQAAAEQLVERVSAQNQANQDNATVVILACE